MLINNKKFLNAIKKKKMIVVFDISGSIPDEVREQIVPTMMALVDNCKIKSKPTTQVFTCEGPSSDYHFMGRKTRKGHGSDLERMYAMIDIMHEQPDALLIITDGYFVWPKENMLPHVKQYIQLIYTSPDTKDTVPDYIEVI